jgi:hypothetical protein
LVYKGKHDWFTRGKHSWFTRGKHSWFTKVSTVGLQGYCELWVDLKVAMGCGLVKVQGGVCVLRGGLGEPVLGGR